MAGDQKQEVSDFCKHEPRLVSPYVSLKEQTIKEPRSRFFCTGK